MTQKANFNPAEIVDMYENGHLQRVRNEFKSLSEERQAQVIQLAESKKISNATRFFKGIVSTCMVFVM